jgi:hypothetical protein
MDLDAPHIEQARNDALLKANLFDRAQLEVSGMAAEKTALEDETVVRDGDLGRPHRKHYHEKENAAGRARGRGE